MRAVCTVVARQHPRWIIRQHSSSLPLLYVRPAGRASLQRRYGSTSTARAPLWPRRHGHSAPRPGVISRGLSSCSDPDGIAAGALREELAAAAAGKSELLVIDVRSPLEVHSTGAIHVDPSLCENVPLDRLFAAFAMDDDEWEDEFGFAKPAKDRPVRSHAFLCRSSLLVFVLTVACGAPRATISIAGVQLRCRDSQRACVASRERSGLHECAKLQGWGHGVVQLLVVVNSKCRPLCGWPSDMAQAYARACVRGMTVV